MTVKLLKSPFRRSSIYSRLLNLEVDDAIHYAITQNLSGLIDCPFSATILEYYSTIDISFKPQRQCSTPSR